MVETMTVVTWLFGHSISDHHFRLTSEAFRFNEAIPAKYTCKQNDVSPPLEWNGIPEGTESLALIMEDPDAPTGTWVHWVVYDIPAHLTGLKEMEDQDIQKQGLGKNSWNEFSYRGPCPPSGTHRYFFHLYALDSTLHFNHPPTAIELRKAMKDHVINQAILMGKFSAQ